MGRDSRRDSGCPVEMLAEADCPERAEEERPERARRPGRALTRVESEEVTGTGAPRDLEVNGRVPRAFAPGLALRDCRERVRQQEADSRGGRLVEAQAANGRGHGQPGPAQGAVGRTGE